MLREYKLLLENHKYNTTANSKCMGLSRVVRKQHSLICHCTAIQSRSHESNMCVNHFKALVFLYAFEESVDCHLLSCFCNGFKLALMHCICLAYFSVVAWNTLKDMQNYSNYTRLYVISNYRHSSVSQTILHHKITKSKSSPDAVLVNKI